MCHVHIGVMSGKRDSLLMCYVLFSSDELSQLRRRYWNDDIQPCIEKFCMRFLRSKSYVHCLQHYCPGSLLAVPRDLEDATLFPVAHLLAETRFCHGKGERRLGSNTDCLGKDCRQEALTSHEDDTFERKVFDFCRQSLCSNQVGSGHAQCVIERCCGGKADPEPENALPMDRFHLSRKRRINDDVSQCIQSYCSGKSLNDKISCIIQKCNRIM